MKFLNMNAIMARQIELLLTKITGNIEKIPGFCPGTGSGTRFVKYFSSPAKQECEEFSKEKKVNFAIAGANYLNNTQCLQLMYYHWFSPFAIKTTARHNILAINIKQQPD